MDYRPSQLVRVTHGEWTGAYGLVKFTRPDGVWVRLGNGCVVTLADAELEPVEYMPGTGCPAAFYEECHGALSVL